MFGFGVLCFDPTDNPSLCVASACLVHLLFTGVFVFYLLESELGTCDDHEKLMLIPLCLARVRVPGPFFLNEVLIYSKAFPCNTRSVSIN